MDDKPENLPGDWVIDLGEAKKVYAGEESVKALPPDESDEIEIEIDLEAYRFYFSIWEKWHYLKMLPNANNGWIDEIPWIIDCVIMFEKLYNELEIFRMNKKG